MRKDRELRLGEKVEIISSYDGNGEIYSSMVQDIDDDGSIVIDLPTSKGNPIYLHLGQKITVSYFRCHGQYYFTGIVVDRYERSNLHYFRIKMASRLRRIQRRSFYRLKKVIPIEIKILDEDKKDVVKTIKTYTYDICGGGVGVVTTQKFYRDTYVKCIFSIPSSDIVDRFDIKGKVVRCKPIEDEMFEVGICFEQISEQQRDAIIRFIFDEQRRLRSKGLV